MGSSTRILYDDTKERNTRTHPGRPDERPSLTPDALLDLVLTDGAEVTLSDAVCTALLLPDAPIEVSEQLLIIGPSKLEFDNIDHALAAALAVHWARQLVAGGVCVVRGDTPK